MIGIIPYIPQIPSILTITTKRNNLPSKKLDNNDSPPLTQKERFPWKKESRKKVKKPLITEILQKPRNNENCWIQSNKKKKINIKHKTKIKKYDL